MAAGMGVSMKLTEVLEKITSKDKDFRFMALSDLLAELAKDSLRLDGDLQARVCKAVIDRLGDEAGDITALAVKCLAALVTRVTDVRLGEVCDQLCARILQPPTKRDPGANRDVAAIALRAVVGEVRGQQAAQAVVKVVIPQALQGISQHKDTHDFIAADCLDVLAEALGRFGAAIPQDHPQCLAALIASLAAPRPGLRKRAIGGLARLAPHLEEGQLAAAVKDVLSPLSGSAHGDVARTHVQAMGAMARATGHRYAPFLSQSWPLAASLCRGADEEDHELREYCLQALETFVDRCPRDMEPALPEITRVCLEFLSFDPNWAADDEEGGEGGDGDEEMEGSGGEEEGGEYTDDEDMSWKVRRASAKCLSSLARCLPWRAPDLYREAAPRLLMRFGEREEGVRLDVFETFADLLRASAASPPALELVRADAPKFMNKVARALNNKSPKTRRAALSVLHVSVAALPPSIRGAEGAVLGGIAAALQDKSTQSSALKVDALAVLREALSRPESAALLRPHTGGMVAPLTAAVGERYYRTTADALRASELLFRTALGGSPPPPPTDGPVRAALSDALLDAVEARLAAQDQDQEVKECALAAAAALISLAPDGALGVRGGRLMGLLMDRLRNESTRLAAVRALDQVLSSPRPGALSSLPPPSDLLPELTGFLRKVNRPLRQAALRCLEGLSSRLPPAQIPSDAAAAAVKEAAALVSDTDLPLAAQALSLLSVIAARVPGLAAQVSAEALAPTKALVLSGLSVGSAALGQAIELICLLARSGAVQVNELTTELLARASDASAPKDAAPNAARCIAAAIVGQGGAADATGPHLARLLKEVQGRTSTERVAVLALGEVGRRIDLSGTQQGGEVVSAITSRLKAAAAGAAGGEGDRLAASCALGAVACGNLPHFLPLVLGSISEAAAAKDSHQYLMVYALREIISHSGAGAAAAGGAAPAGGGKGAGVAGLTPKQEEEVVSMLVRSCEAEEGVRSLAAECLGGLATALGPRMNARLLSLARDPSPAVRACALAAVRHTLSDRGGSRAQAADRDTPDSPLLPQLLPSLSEDDLGVAKAALQLLAAAVHNRPRAALPLLASDPALLDGLYKHATKKPHLIKTVNLGPFKHQVDEGLDCRKSAYETLSVVLESCPDRLPPGPFLRHLAEGGLRDAHEVRVHALGLVVRATHLYPSHVAAALDLLCPPLEETLTAKLKAEAVKQEADRHEEVLRAALRAVHALTSVATPLPGHPPPPGAPLLQSLVERVVMGQEDLRKKYEEAQQQTA